MSSRFYCRACLYLDVSGKVNFFAQQNFNGLTDLVYPKSANELITERSLGAEFRLRDC